ncbi:hypothetical protein [Marivita hallyeonensis]|uniref:Uncharacterized protein n=1 Tax=Marivita hallyeonensis TaxID=996342 RepID=A0A1M5MGQ4_9RHOB|nr:hypothetical protein [Marivita hallyeonensis]SHG76500.1 hypothetical protein SAMN05443551_0513 [Marivita hallyeonensis]
MTHDLVHAVITGALVFSVMMGLQKAGLYKPHKEGGPRWSWPLFFGVAVSVFILNLIWP